MIDKFDSHDKLLELTYLNNFGINLGVHKKLKAIISSNNKENEQEFINILESLELKQLLIIYKYLYICSKKVDKSNLFYKLDFEQIDEDLYEDFCKREQKGDKNLTKAEIEQRKRQAYLRAELNIGGFKLTEEDKKVTEVDYSKLNKKKEEPPVNKPKANLGKLLDNELNENENKESNNKGNKGKKKKGKKKFVDFDINNFDLDKDFPKFK